MQSQSPNRLKLFLIYTLMLAIGLGIFLFINEQGQTLSVTASQTSALPQTHAQINNLLHVLLALATVIVTARVVGTIFRFISQPPVIGEVIGGILLGPSFLGHWAPEVYATVLPPSAAPFLGIIAQLGIIFYMFIVGLELDLDVIKKSGHTTLAISHASILLPFLLGVTLAYSIYQASAPPGVAFTPFSLFLGVSLSVTAFPVLARILTDRNIHKTPLGAIALTCAAVDDVTAWCLLALVVSVAQAKVGSALATLVLTIAYIVAMFLFGRPLIQRLLPSLEKLDQITEGGMALFFVGLLLSALATEMIGIHAIFGAFLLGAITPHDSKVAGELTKRIQDLVKIIFLPAFFAFTGMRTQINLLETPADWQLCGLIILVATLGKFGGTFIAAKLTGLGWRDSSALGVLMNTRGLVELIVLNLGMDMQIITPRLFAMLVVMALVTTFATTPILHLITGRHSTELK